MKAAVRERYGAPDDVVELRDVDRPNPADDGLLVRVPLDEIVDALRYVDTGGAKGKVLITV